MLRIRRRPAAARPRVVAACALAAALLATTASRPAAASSYPAIGPSGRVAEPPFSAGERLVFEIKYGFVSAGTASMGIPDVVRERGYPCYHIVSVAESNPVFSAFFTVRDVAE